MDNQKENKEGKQKPPYIIEQSITPQESVSIALPSGFQMTLTSSVHDLKDLCGLVVEAHEFFIDGSKRKEKTFYG